MAAGPGTLLWVLGLSSTPVPRVIGRNLILKVISCGCVIVLYHMHAMPVIKKGGWGEATEKKMLHCHHTGLTKNLKLDKVKGPTMVCLLPLRVWRTGQMWVNVFVFLFLASFSPPPPSSYLCEKRNTRMFQFYFLGPFLGFCGIVVNKSLLLITITQSLE